MIPERRPSEVTLALDELSYGTTVSYSPWPDNICRCCKIERFINPNHPDINCWRCKDHAKACRVSKTPAIVAETNENTFLAPTDGQVLVSDGNGKMSWATVTRNG